LLSLACVQVSDAVLEHDQNRRQAPSAAFGQTADRASLARGYHVLVCGCHTPDGVPDVIGCEAHGKRS